MATRSSRVSYKALIGLIPVLLRIAVAILLLYVVKLLGLSSDFTLNSILPVLTP